MARAMASLLSRQDLGLAELHAARLDGELFAVDERFAPLDEVDSPHLRASALRQLGGDRLIAELGSALWIRGLRSQAPRVHRVCVPREDRMKFPPSARFVVREITHRPGDAERIAGMLVCVPSRILYDLALVGGAEAAMDARLLLSTHPELGAECAARLRGAYNLPGKRDALARLVSWTEAEGRQQSSAWRTVA